ncbi:armadillo repeat kinesin 3 [Actinidia rufa]|uniref:Kinesin-like protein n=1 Tax=Actinidia rufa TaxID=165716 RepID=A0A7J0FR92_9ERIC|nr:armadillo repeat kinesin 3 [Actinidia rufa]
MTLQIRCRYIDTPWTRVGHAWHVPSHATRVSHVIPSRDTEETQRSVLDGYNGTVMAYGQTGTGKTYTLGRLGEEDTAYRGIMLYMETIQDLLVPANDNISIMEDPKTGDVSLPGATLVEIRDQESFVELLRLGEAHRFAANTKLNTESSRSHAILMVTVRRSVKGKDHALSSEHGNTSNMLKTLKPPIVRKGKLVVVDLAGSEGHTLEEAKSINLSLSALGKCINALAENSAHVPSIYDVIASSEHTQEEFDYKSLSRRLDIQLDRLIADHERQQKALQDEIERITIEAQKHISEAERSYTDALEREKFKYQKDYMESLKKLEEQWSKEQQKHDDGNTRIEQNDDSLIKTSRKEAPPVSSVDRVAEVKKLLQDEIHSRKSAEEEVNNLRTQLMLWKRTEREILRSQNFGNCWKMRLSKNGNLKKK